MSTFVRILMLVAVACGCSSALAQSSTGLAQSSTALSQSSTETLHVLTERLDGRKRIAAGDVEFELYWAGDGPHDPSSSPFFQGRTGAAGELRVELDRKRLTTNRRSVVNVRGWVQQAGLQRRFAVGQRVGQGKDARLELRLDVVPGASALVRCVDGNDQPVKAVLTFERDVIGAGGRVVRTYASGIRHQGTGKGCFALHFAEGEDVTIVAESRGLGTGRAEDVKLRLEKPLPCIEIRIAGEGRITGRLKQKDGGACAFALVRVRPVDTADLNGPGFRDAETRTDQVGSFSFSGLTVAEYEIVVPDLHASGEENERVLGQVRASSDAAKVAFEFTRPYLHIELQRPDGAPLEATGQRVPVGGTGTATWPERPSVRVLDLGATERASSPELRGPTADARAVYDQVFGPLPTEHDPPANERIIDVRRGHRYLVAVIGGPFPMAPIYVDVPEDGARIPVVFRAAANAEPCQVAVALDLSATEGAVRRGGSITIELLHAATQMTVATADVYDFRKDIKLTAPPGRYVAVAKGHSFRDDHHGTHMNPRQIGRAALPVDLVRGAPAAIELRPGPVGFLEIDLRGAPERDPDTGFGTVSITAYSPVGWYEPVTHVAQTALPYGPHELDEWTIGEAKRSEGLPVGLYTLVARARDGREATARVTVSAGVAKPITLDLGE